MTLGLLGTYMQCMMYHLLGAPDRTVVPDQFHRCDIHWRWAIIIQIQIAKQIRFETG